MRHRVGLAGELGFAINPFLLNLYKVVINNHLARCVVGLVVMAAALLIRPGSGRGLYVVGISQ